MKRQQSVTLAIICSIALIIIGLKYLGGIWPFRVVNDQILNPIGSVFSGFGRGLNYSLSIFTKATELSRENKAQASEILSLKNQLSTLKEVANENDELRAQLSFNERLKLDLTAARVVSSEGTSLRKFITIDRGKNSGLREGMAVISSGVLIGTVDRVEDFSSTVFLSSDPDFRIRALGQDGRAQGVVRGQLGQGYIFDKITQSESVKRGESVITFGSGLVPKGILIGEVESVSRSDNAVFQSAQLRPLVNVSSVEVVFVVTGLKQ